MNSIHFEPSVESEGDYRVSESDGCLVLADTICINPEQWPELEWLKSYLQTKLALQAELQTLEQEITRIQSEGDVAPKGWFIEPYTTPKKLASGEIKHYGFHRWETAQGYKPKHIHISSKDLHKAQSSFRRRQRIDRLQSKREALEKRIHVLRQKVLAVRDSLLIPNCQNQNWEGGEVDA